MGAGGGGGGGGMVKGVLKKRASGTTALMVLDRVNNATALRRPGHRSPRASIPAQTQFV